MTALSIEITTNSNIKDNTVCCDGRTVANPNIITHPKVYIKIKDGKAICPYCNTCYIVK